MKTTAFAKMYLHHVMAAIIWSEVSYPLLVFLTSAASTVEEIFSLDTLCTLLNIHIILKDIHKIPHTRQHSDIPHELSYRLVTNPMFSCSKSKHIAFRLIFPDDLMKHHHISKNQKTVIVHKQ
jgi:hypothetical protein